MSWPPAVHLHAKARHIPRTETLVDFVPFRFPLRPHLTVPVTRHVQFRNLQTTGALPRQLREVQSWLNATASHTRKIQAP